MSACKHYNTKGYYRCALKMQKACNECGQFDPYIHGVEFEITDNTVLGAKPNPHVGSEFDAEEYCGSTVAKPTVDTVIPDTDAVNSPAHYAGHYPVEVKEIIQIALAMIVDGAEESMTPWQIYCLGNELKYRLRAGLKGDAAEDIAKAMKYAEFRREG